MSLYSCEYLASGSSANLSIHALAEFRKYNQNHWASKKYMFNLESTWIEIGLLYWINVVLVVGFYKKKIYFRDSKWMPWSYLTNSLKYNYF